MPTLTEMEEKEYRKRFDEFFKRYGHLYKKGTQKFIKEKFLGEEFKSGNYIDIMSQIYEEIGLLSKYERDLYSEYLNYMKKYFDINRNLLDVGCGHFPSFTKKVAASQTSGSVKGIDHHLITTDIEGLILENGVFNRSYDVSGIDMLYGLEPCDATIDMIRVANKNNLDLCLALCGDIHFNIYISGMDQSDYRCWLAYLLTIMEATLPDDRGYEIELTDFFRYPIFRTYKKKTLIQTPEIII